MKCASVVASCFASLLGVAWLASSVWAGPLPSAHYAFDEGSGSSVADSQGGLSGTIAGTEGTNFRWESPGMTKGDPYRLHVNSPTAGSGVAVPDQASLDAASAVTVSAWFNWDSAGANWEGIVAKRGSVTTNYGINLRNNALQWYFIGGGTMIMAAPGGFSPAAGKDWHFTGTFQQAGTSVVGTMYLNGTALYQQTLANKDLSATQNNDPLCIGQTMPGTERFRGSVDNVKIWNAAALGPAEVRALFAEETLSRMLSLADVVGGGNGWGTGANRGISPLDGSVQTAHGQSMTGDHAYHLVSANPMVDGVFVPDGATQATQLNSSGATYRFPSTNNLTWDYVWNSPVGGSDLNGIDFATPGHSMIALHANKGITFDLDAIRHANGGLHLERFLSLVGNTASATGGYWVFLDGQLVASGLNTPTNQGYLIDVAIGDQNRFLTLVGTDGGDGYSNDQVFFGDPFLLMAVPEPSALLLLGLGGTGLLGYWRRRPRS